MKSALPAFLYLLLFVSFSYHANEDTQFWISSGASNWNNPANWSASSGGIAVTRPEKPIH